MQLANNNIGVLLKNIAGTSVKVYPSIAVDSPSIPFIVYRNNNYSPDRSKDGIESFVSEYSVTICHKTFDAAMSLSDRILSSVDGYSDDVIMSCKFFSGGDRGYEDGGYVHELLFSVESRNV